MRRRHAKFGEHFRTRLDHHWRAAKIKLDPADVRVVFKGHREDDFMNEARVASPFVLVKRGRQGCVK